MKSPEDIQAARHHEEALIGAFVQSQRRERLLLLLGGKKGRDKFRRMLAHPRYLDERFARPIPANEHSPSAIAQRLRTQGAPERCYVISEITELDGQWMPLHDALAQSVGRGMGTFISCVPGRLAYFEAEDAGERYVLQRNQPR